MTNTVPSALFAVWIFRRFGGMGWVAGHPGAVPGRFGSCRTVVVRLLGVSCDDGARRVGGHVYGDLADRGTAVVRSAGRCVVTVHRRVCRGEPARAARWSDLLQPGRRPGSELRPRRRPGRPRQLPRHPDRSLRSTWREPDRPVVGRPPRWRGCAVIASALVGRPGFLPSHLNACVLAILMVGEVGTIVLLTRSPTRPGAICH